MIFDPPSLNFLPDLVTPEPETGLMLLAAAIAACIVGKRRPLAPARFLCRCRHLPRVVDKAIGRAEVALQPPI